MFCFKNISDSISNLKEMLKVVKISSFNFEFKISTRKTK